MTIAKTHNRVQRADMFHIGKIIESNVVPDGEADGRKFVKYKEGWDDERVSKVAGGVAVSVVQNIRRDLFGEIRRGDGKNWLSGVSARMDALERRIAELEDAITKPRVLKSFSDLPVVQNTYGTVTPKS